MKLREVEVKLKIWSATPLKSLKRKGWWEAPNDFTCIKVQANVIRKEKP